MTEGVCEEWDKEASISRCFASIAASRIVTVLFSNTHVTIMPTAQPPSQHENALVGSLSSLPAHVAARLRSRSQQSLTSPLKAPQAADSASLMQRLSSEVRGLETAGRQATSKQTISCGCEALDHYLPDGGYVPGSVIEYLRAMPGCGVSTLAFTAAAAAMKSTNGFVVIIDTQHNIYPPALASWGINLEKVVLVRPQSDVDALWAVDQSLRTPAVAAVVADVERIDDRAARRMQLAAEQGGGLALLLRPASARRGPSWADIQWMVRGLPSQDASPTQNVAHQNVSGSVVDDASVRTSPSFSSLSSPTSLNQDRRLQVQLVRVRGGKAGATVRLRVSARDGTLQEVERHEPTGALHLASQLASAASPSRRAAAS